MAVAPGGTGGAGLALVANFAGQTVSPVDLGTRRVGALVPVGPEPVAVAVAPGGTGGAGLALVADYGDDVLTPLDLGTMTTGGPVALPGAPTGVVIAPDGRVAWVTCASAVVPVSLASMSVGPAVTLPGVTEALAFGRGSSRHATIWVAEQEGRLVPVRVGPGGEPLSATISGTVGRGTYVGGRPSAVEVTP